MNQKPIDYSKYFNKDGIPKENPYDAFTDIKQADNMRIWYNRQKEIAYSLMTNEERTYHRELCQNWKDKVQSSFGDVF